MGAAVPPCSLCIQLHHPWGRNHENGLTDPLCEVHHREIHEQMLKTGVSLSFERDVINRTIQVLRADAVYERARADAKDRLANLLEQSRGERQWTSAGRSRRGERTQARNRR